MKKQIFIPDVTSNVGAFLDNIEKDRFEKQ